MPSEIATSSALKQTRDTSDHRNDCTQVSPPGGAARRVTRSSSNSTANQPSIPTLALRQVLERHLGKEVDAVFRPVLQVLADLGQGKADPVGTRRKDSGHLEGHSQILDVLGLPGGLLIVQPMEFVLAVAANHLAHIGAA